MKSSRLPAAVVVVALCFLLSSRSFTQAQTLTAVKCNGSLPTGRITTSTLYDNNDSIYIFGGYDGTPGYVDLDDVLKYSISTDTTELVGQLPYADHGGKAIMNKLGTIFYLAGRKGSDIFQYFPQLRSFEYLTSFPDYNSQFASVQIDNDTALLFGGIDAPFSIISLNLNTLESQQIAGLPERTSYPKAMWVEQKDVVYLFQNSETVQKYNRSSNRTEVLSLRVPYFGDGYAGVWDGRFGYLIGILDDEESWLQFDPETETVAVIPVEGYVPVASADAVYIKKLNRIYTFGGATIVDGQWVYHPEIYYTDLDPLDQPSPPTTTTTDRAPIPSTMDPDVFDCAGRPDSNYPYPGDCTKFVICEGGHGYAFNCEEALHFDPVNRYCTFPP